jgi:hypothetical protein
LDRMTCETTLSRICEKCAVHLCSGPLRSEARL